MHALVAVIVGICMALGCARGGPTTAPANTSASAPAAGHGGHPAEPAARTTLLGNLGDYHRAITVSHADAQRFFDEGLTLLYGFNHEEAFRSFERAAMLDPEAPMPHWGMSLALGTNYNDTATPDRLLQAHLHLTHAQERAANGTEAERAFIDALASRYVATPNDGNQPAREAAYSAAMAEVSKRFPDDLDAATLYAESMMNLRPWKLYTCDGDPEPGTELIVKTLGALQTSAARVAKDVMYSTVNPAPLVLEVARLDLTARIADARGGGAAATAAWRRAVAAEDKVGYGEPPDWLFPTREGLAASLMRAGNAVEAEKVYRADLTKNRKNPRSLFGLWKALERQRKTAEAAKVKAEFDAAWAGADVTLSESDLTPRKTTN